MPRVGAFWSLTGVKLANDGKFVLAALNKSNVANCLVVGNFSAINRDGVAGEKFATFALAGSKTSLDEDIEELGALVGGREALCEQIEFFGA